MTQTHRPRRSLRALAAAAATVAMTAGGLALASVPAQAANDGCPPPSAKPPTANNWYDANGKYGGTRVLSRENYKGIQATIVYETIGPGYRQVETWDTRLWSSPMRLDCRRDRLDPDPEPGEPIKVGGGSARVSHGGGYYIPGGNYTVVVNPHYTGSATVGPVENVQ